jgi:hypothetical protein
LHVKYSQSIFFEEVPLPPEQVRFTSVRAQIYPDGRRVKIKMEITPFLQPPDIEVQAYNPQGNLVASASIIEIGSRDMEITLHLRGEISSGEYLCRIGLRSPGDQVDTREVAFSIFGADNQDTS